MTKEREILLKKYQRLLRLSQWELEKTLEELDETYDLLSEYSRGYIASLPDGFTRGDLHKIESFFRDSN